MGGRGSYSYSGKRSAKDGSTLSAYAVASLNKGAAGGTTVESAIDRFREQLMGNRHEYSAYIDDALRSGVQCAMCSTAMRDRNLTPEDMIEGAREIVGMVSMLEAAMDPESKVLVY